PTTSHWHPRLIPMVKKAKKSPPAKRRPGTVRRKAQTGELLVFEHLSLANVRLLGLNAKLEVVDGNLPTVPNIESSVTIGPSEGEDRLLVDGTLKIDARPADLPKSLSRMSIEVHLQCVYKVEQPIGNLEKHARLLAQGGMYVMWPHF